MKISLIELRSRWCLLSMKIVILKIVERFFYLIFQRCELYAVFGVEEVGFTFQLKWFDMTNDTVKLRD